MNAPTRIEQIPVNVTEIMLALNIGKIERYPGGYFTVALMDGSWGQGKSAGEAYDNIKRKRVAA